MVLRLAPWGKDPANWPENVWIGTSVGSPRTAALFLPYLVEIPARIRFLSVEPYLEEVDLSPWLSVIHWCIFGGESGPQARPMELDWTRKGIRQCRDAGTAVFVKQLGQVYAQQHRLKHPKGGDINEWPVDLRIRELPRTEGAGPVG